MTVSSSGKKYHKKSLDIKRYTGAKKAADIRKKIHLSKLHKKASDLRNYAKLCEKEGIISDRVRLKSSTTVEEDSNHKLESKVKEKTPFAHSLQVAAQKRSEIEIKKNAKLEEKKLIEQAKFIRDKNRELHLKKTKKGQPNLNCQIKDILNKLYVK